MTENPNTPAWTARKFNELEIDWLVYERGSKDPHRPGWQKEKTPPLSDASSDKNIGVQLRRGLVDSDLDTIEAGIAARFYLPESQMRWGRDSKPVSHYLYQVNHEAQIGRGKRVYDDPSPTKGLKARLLELREKGQTVAPGSLHADSGEIVSWNACFGPSSTTPELLQDAARHIASAALVARYWNDGGRHDMALPLAGFLWHGGMPLAGAEKFMEAVCTAAGDLDALDNRLGCVRDTYRIAGNGGAVTGGPTLEEYLTEAQVRKLRKWLELKSQHYSGILGPDLLPLAGDGDGDRFAAMWSGQVLYSAETDTWYVYDGRRFKLDTVKEIKERAKLVVGEFRRVLGEKQGLCGQNGIAPYPECADYSKKMGHDGNIAAMLRSAQSKAEIRVTQDEFDADPLLFNCLNGTVELDITTGEVRSHLHRPEDRITALAPVNYYPDAVHPLIKQYLTRFYPEADRRDFLGEIAGYAALGEPKRHAAQLIGKHDSGKSTTLKIFQAAWGDYAASLKDTALMKNPYAGGDQGRPDLWRVRNKRLVVIYEVSPDAHFDVALFKSLLSGGDTVGIRTLFDRTGGEDVRFVFSLWMSGNKPYGPPPDEQAAFDRLDVLDCSHVVAEDDRDPAEERALTDSQEVRDAAFAFAMAGFKRLYGEKRGVLKAPESSQVAKAKLINDLDRWTEVITAVFEVTLDQEDGVPKSEAWIWARTEAKMDRNSYKAQQAFEASLERRGLKLTNSKARFSNNLYWSGLKVKSTEAA